MMVVLKMSSTHRLVHIVKAYSIFGDKAKAIQVCVNRFDDETKQAFLELYDKVDVDFVMPSENRVPLNAMQLFDIIMTNSWSFLYDELYANKKMVNIGVLLRI